MYFLNKPPR